MYSIHYFYQTLTKYGAYRHILWKSLIPNFTEIRQVDGALIHANGRADGHDEASKRFSPQWEHA